LINGTVINPRAASWSLVMMMPGHRLEIPRTFNMLESEKQEPKGYNDPEKWIVVSAFLMAMVYAIIFIVIWPLLSTPNLHAHLLSRAKNDYGSLTGPKLFFLSSSV
jgi:hypothetical protein